MRPIILFILLHAAIPVLAQQRSAAPIVAQIHQTQSQPDGRVSLELGSVTVWLGISKAEVVKQFSDASYKFADMGNGLLASSGPEAASYRLGFKNGRLVYAEVSWYNKNTEEIDAVLGALGALAEKNELSTLFSLPPASFNTRYGTRPRFHILWRQICADCQRQT